MDINTIETMYNDIIIFKDENGLDELGFTNEFIAKEFVKMTSKLSIIYREDRTRYSMQFVADILKKLNEEGVINRKDLYILKESDIINIIEKSSYKDIFDIWRKSKFVLISDNKPENVYYVHHDSKVRYIDPLLNGLRISKINEQANKYIQDNLSYKTDKYVYLDFNF